jgi:hypothetical protein
MRVFFENEHVKQKPVQESKAEPELNIKGIVDVKTQTTKWLPKD